MSEHTPIPREIAGALGKNPEMKLQNNVQITYQEARPVALEALDRTDQEKDEAAAWNKLPPAEKAAPQE